MKKNITLLALFICIVYQGDSYAFDKKPKPKPEPPPIEKFTTIIADHDPYKQCKATVLPSFINNSMYWGDGFGKNGGRTAYRAFNAISPPSIIVTAAGNFHPRSAVPPYKAKAAKDFDAIVVGSMAPNGNRSQFSQQGEAVHIMAPSHYSLTSADENGNYRRFGGTSGATPLVTGSLAGFEWLSGYHPTAAEAKILLAKTAIPNLSANDKPRRNGVGMVNAYKLGMVGKRLKQLCRNNVSCFKKLIQKDSTYTFSEDFDLSKKLDQVFPECSRTVCNSNSDNHQYAMCVDKAAVVERLRKAAFLNPQNKELWRNLACVYASGDFTRNSEGIMSFYRALSGEYGKNSKFCRLDEDCTLVPACDFYNLSSSSGGLGGSFSSKKNEEGESNFLPRERLLPMNKDMAELHYIEYCLKENGTVCNKNITALGGEGVSVASRNVQESKCINSQCVNMYVPLPELIKKSLKIAPMPIQKKNSNSSGSVQ